MTIEKRRDDTNGWTPHEDLSRKRTRARQNTAAVMMVQAHRRSMISANDDGFQLPAAVCQFEARLNRVNFERSGFVRLSQLEAAGAQILAFTLDVSAGGGAEPFGANPDRVSKLVALSLAEDERVLCAFALLDTAYTTGRGSDCWEPHFQGCVAVEASSVKKAAKIVSRALRPIRSRSTWRQPLRCIPITDLSGALRYAGKALCIDAINRRTCWRVEVDERSRLRLAKRKIQRSQRVALALQLLEIDPVDRLMTVGLERSFDLSRSDEFGERTAHFFARAAARRR